MQNVNKEKILKRVKKGHETWTFAKGWFKAYATLPECKMQELHDAICQELKFTNYVTFYRRLIGVRPPTILEMQGVMSVFATFGITEVYYTSAEDYEADLATL